MIGEKQQIKLRDGIELHAEVFENDASMWIIVTHGVSEHYRRQLFIKDLFGKKFNILFYDLRGHGQSGGHPLYVDDFDDFAYDLIEVIEYLKKRYHMNDFLLYGHSMGALITANFLKNFAHQDMYPRLVYLSSPPVGAGGPVGKLANSLPAPTFSLLRNLPISIRLKALLPDNALSHDPQVHKEADEDPYSCNGLHTKLGFEIMKCAREVFSGPIHPQCPAYISIGSGDIVVSPEAAINYFSNVEKDFDLKIIEGAYHEIHKEVERYRVPYFEYMKNAVFSVLD